MQNKALLTNTEQYGKDTQYVQYTVYQELLRCLKSLHVIYC